MRHHHHALSLALLAPLACLSACELLPTAIIDFGGTGRDSSDGESDGNGNGNVDVDGNGNGNGNGDGDGDGDGGVDGPRCDDVILAGPSPLTRLHHSELRVAWRDLTGDDGADLALEADIGRALTEAAIERLADATIELAERAALRSDIVPCDADDRACVLGALAEFSARAAHRPIDDAERDVLARVYAAAAAVDPATGVVAGIAVVLQSPALLYVPVAGDEGAVRRDDDERELGPGVRALTGHERATRLALFLTGAPPDGLLLEAAARGDLDTKAGGRAAAERLLGTDAARAVVRTFFTDALQLNGATVLPSLEENPKDADRLPEDSPALRAAMREETLAFAERMSLDEERGWPLLFTSTDAYINAPLADLYGVPAPDASAFGWPTLPAGERAGLFTRAGSCRSTQGSACSRPSAPASPSSPASCASSLVSRRPTSPTPPSRAVPSTTRTAPGCTAPCARTWSPPPMTRRAWAVTA
jgi:hypothetical protein